MTASGSLVHAVVGGTLPVVRHGVDLVRVGAPILRHWGGVASSVGALAIAARTRRRGFADTVWAYLDVVLGVNAFMKVLGAYPDGRPSDS